RSHEAQAFEPVLQPRHPEAREVALRSGLRADCANVLAMRLGWTYVGLGLAASCIIAGSAHADDSHLRPKNRRALEAYREAVSFLDRSPPDYDSGIKLLRKALMYERAAGILRNLAI